MNTSLSPSEAENLRSCEATIERGLTVFVEVGKALTQIRDSKLYRSTHKTFEAYCKERWEIGRTRAYDLIDQAKVTEALSTAGVVLSPTATNDGVSRNDARIIKDDPAAIDAIKSRVDAGEQPADAIKAVATQVKADKADQQEVNDREREAANAAWSPEVQEHRARTEEHRAKAKAEKSAPARTIEQLEAEIDELREANASLEAELAEVKAESAQWQDMRVQFEQGGFEKVIADLREEIRGLETRVETESTQKVRNLRDADKWRKRAIEAGWSNDIVIDIETGEVVNG